MYRFYTRISICNFHEEHTTKASLKNGCFVFAASLYCAHIKAKYAFYCIYIWSLRVLHLVCCLARSIADDDNALHTELWVASMSPFGMECALFVSTYLTRHEFGGRQSIQLTASPAHQFITINYVRQQEQSICICRSATDYKSLLLKFALKQLHFNISNFSDWRI